MQDIRIQSVGDMASLQPDVTPQHWNIGRSGDLGQGVEVWTSWLPVQGYYETLVVDRQNHSGFGGLLGETWLSFSPEQAAERHREIVDLVRRKVAR